MIQRTGIALFALAAVVCVWRPSASPPSPVGPTARWLVTLADDDPSALAARHAVSLGRWVPALRLAVLEGPANTAAALARDPSVQRLGPDRQLRLTARGCCAELPEDADPDLEAEHRRVLQAFGPLQAPDAGAGQLVAVLDTGCDAEHPALVGRLATGVSLIPGAPWSEDVHGHGTAMASLIAGLWRDDDGCPVQTGVAPAVRVLPVRVAGPDGLARLSDVAAGIVAAADRGAGVILLSMGSRLPAPALRDALAYAEARDALVVAAAGNRNVHHDLHPAADPRTLSVGCVEDDGALAGATALSASTDLLLPGVEVAAAQPRRGLAHLTGTSVAAARAAGVAALVRGRRPDLDPAGVRALLRATGRPLPLFAGDPTLGAAFPAAVFDAAGLSAALRGETAPRLPARPAATPRPGARDLGITRAAPAYDDAGDLTLTVEVEARGLPEGARLEARLAGALSSLASAPVLPVAAGTRQTVELAIPAAALAGVDDLYQLDLVLGGRAPDATPADDRARLDLLSPLAGPRPMRTQYQQSSACNWIADAPTRLEPARSYLPLLVFMPEKGDTDTNTQVDVREARITMRDVPETTGPGALVYEDVQGGATTAPPGLVALDEDGQPVLRGGAPDVRLFQHRGLRTPGAYTILRLPRAALGIAPQPAQVDVRYFEVDLSWRKRRFFLGTSQTLQTERTRWVLKVHFAADPLPRLPGELAGDYYDAHCHSIAEWNQESTLNPLSPKKNFGGPIPMIQEAAHAIGLTDAVDARGRVIVTDHNVGYNAGDTLALRPPLGPSSTSSAGPGVSEREVFRDVFGITSGEEVTIAGSIRRVQVGPVTLDLPNGAHMLTYRGEHIEGPWHGGSNLARLLGDPSPDLTMEVVLDRLTRQNRAANQHAAGYAAHPFGANDWTAEHFQVGFEMDPARRQDRPVHVEQTGFVTKGVQFWNGDGRRNALASSLIDWNDLNPWKDPDFVRGRYEWDSRTLYRYLRVFHETLIEPLLSYELASRPGVRFPRKVFMVAGNDAHGDFNFRTDRSATLITSQSSFQVDGRSFGDVKTYAMPAGQTATDPAEAAFEALIDGNSVLTDGPVLGFALDGEDRFDGADLAWHDARPAFEDRDGRIGGGGAFDGRGTLLVRRGSPHVRFGYRHTNTAEFHGDVEAIQIHRTSVGDVNPESLKPASRGGEEWFEPRGSLAPGAPDTDLDEALDPAEEGTIDAPTALHLQAFTDPDPIMIEPDGRRCLTNAVWCVPFDAEATVATVETLTHGDGQIPAGGLTVTLTFDMSLTAADLGVEVKALDTQGNSSGRAVGPAALLTPVGPNHGFSTHQGVVDSQLTLTNSTPLPLNLDRYPGPADVTFVVYTYATPQDPFGNALHPVAFTFTTPGIGVGGGTGPTLTRQPAGGATTAPGATPGGAQPTGGSGGGGGCALTAAPNGRAPWSVGVLITLLVALRLRAPQGVDEA